MVVAFYALAYAYAKPGDGHLPPSLLIIFSFKASFWKWLSPLLVILAGLIFAYLGNRLCSMHKIIGKRTRLPVVMSGLYGSLLPFGDGGGIWLLIALLIVWLFDAIFNLQEHEKSRLESLLFSGSLMAIIMALDKSGMWLIPVVFLAVGLFLFLNLQRLGALLWSVFAPLFIIATILLLLNRQEVIVAYWSHNNWLTYAPVSKSKLRIAALILLHAPLMLGWLQMIAHYNSNASKQRKISLLFIVMGALYLVGGLFFKEMRISENGLLLLPAMVFSSSLYARGLNLRAVHWVFFFQLMGWLLFHFETEIMHLLQLAGVSI